MIAPLLEIQNLHTWYPIRAGVLSRIKAHVQAVTDINLSMQAGETLALVGESGCGKSTLGRTILGLERPKQGRVLFKGADLPFVARERSKELRRDIQIIFQDPAASLNSRMTVQDLLSEGPVGHGLITRADAESEALRLLNDVGMDASSLHRYPLEFSGGQRQRLSIARALSVRPSLIVCDEAVSALDVSVQAQVLNLLMDLKERHGLSYLFISHDLRVVRNISDRIAVMYLGRVVEEGATEQVMAKPMHPYTRALFSAIPEPGGARLRGRALKGEVPSAIHPPSGCPFHTRCPQVMEVCPREWPPARVVENRRVCCHLY